MPKWAKNTWDFIKGTAKEVPYYALDVTMGLSNAIDENLAFGVGNKIRENFGVDAYEPYDQSYYSGVYNVGEAGSAVANAYMLATGVGGLSGSLKNITQAFKGGSKIIAGANGVAVLTSSVSWGNVAEGIIGVVRSGALSGWASGNIVYSKWSGRAKNKLKPDSNATGPHTTYKRWAEEIAECQNSGTKISEWCQIKGISCNTYYRRLRIVRNEFLERSESPLREIIPLSIATTPTTKEVPIAAEKSLDHKSEKIFIRKNGMEIELPQSTEEHTLLALLRGLQQC